MANHNIHRLNVIAAAAVLSLASTAGAAKSYSPYGAKLPAKLVGVKSASAISVEAETWPGFNRAFTISLAGIQVPQNSPTADRCERELAKKAQAFVEDFLADTQQVELRDMKMDHSAQQEAVADIATGKGSLAQALVNEGLARPDDVEPTTSWCK